MATTSLKVQVSERAKKLLVAELEQRGMTQIALVERMIDWFTSQDYDARSIILGHVSQSSAADLVEMLYHKRHGQKQGDLSSAPKSVPHAAETRKIVNKVHGTLKKQGTQKALGSKPRGRRSASG